jgi:hypothetical protein
LALSSLVAKIEGRRPRHGSKQPATEGTLLIAPGIAAGRLSDIDARIAESRRGTRNHRDEGRTPYGERKYRVGRPLSSVDIAAEFDRRPAAARSLTYALVCINVVGVKVGGPRGR